MAETSESADATDLRVVRWKQFGQDRLYVNTGDGRRVGWLNLTNGTQVVEIGDLRGAFERALAEYQATSTGENVAPDAPQTSPVAPTPPRDVARRPTASRRPAKRPAKPQARSAGASAQAEYERRAANDRTQRRAKRKLRITALLLAPLVGYGLARAALLLWNHVGLQLRSSVGRPDATYEPVIDASTSHTYALYGALALTLAVLAALVQRKQTTEAFRIGAEGERKTAAILDRLPDGWRVFHDLPMPGGRGNVDHVAVGPTGVFTIETKNYANGVVIKRGVARSSGRDLSKVVDQAKRQMRLIGEITGTAVTPIVVVQGKGVTTEGWLQKPVIDGVHFCSSPRLKKTVMDGRAALGPEEVERIARLIGS